MIIAFNKCFYYTITVGNQESGAPYVLLGSDKKILNNDQNSGINFTMKKGTTETMGVEVISNPLTQAAYSYSALTLNVTNSGSNTKVATLSKSGNNFALKLRPAVQRHCRFGRCDRRKRHGLCQQSQ